MTQALHVCDEHGRAYWFNHRTRRLQCIDGAGTRYERLVHQTRPLEDLAAAGDLPPLIVFTCNGGRPWAT